MELTSLVLLTACMAPTQVGHITIIQNSYDAPDTGRVMCAPQPARPELVAGPSGPENIDCFIILLKKRTLILFCLLSGGEKKVIVCASRLSSSFLSQAAQMLRTRQKQTAQKKKAVGMEVVDPVEKGCGLGKRWRMRVKEGSGLRASVRPPKNTADVVSGRPDCVHPVDTVFAPIEKGLRRELLALCQ